LIFGKIPFGIIFATLWFLLLFLAGITSSVSLAQPAVAFLEDEFNLSRKESVGIFSVVCFVLCQPAIFFLGNGVVDELDFWGGTFSLVLFGTIEAILFSWVFGIDRAWDEMHIGADMKIPKFYKFIIKYITPLFLILILVFWFVQEGIPVILMKNISAENLNFVILTRIMLLGLFLFVAFLVKIAWNKSRIESPE